MYLAYWKKIVYFAVEPCTTAHATYFSEAEAETPYHQSTIINQRWSHAGHPSHHREQMDCKPTTLEILLRLQINQSRCDGRG